MHALEERTSGAVSTGLAGASASRARAWPWRRWASIGLRTLHLLGTAGVGGAFLYGASPELWLPYLWLVAGSGAGMVMLQVWGNPLWLVQLRGVAILVKLGLILMLLSTGVAELALFVAVLVISGVISHAPGDVRYFSLWHGRRVESLEQ